MGIFSNIFKRNSSNNKSLDHINKFYGGDNENTEEISMKVKAFANAAICIQHFFEQTELPEVLNDINLENLSQQMCSPLYHEMDIPDNEWEELDRHVLGFMVIVRNLEEYHTKSIHELFEFYFIVSCSIAGSIADGSMEVNENNITHHYCQNTMDKLRIIGDSCGYK